MIRDKRVRTFAFGQERVKAENQLVVSAEKVLHALNHAWRVDPASGSQNPAGYTTSIHPVTAMPQWGSIGIAVTYDCALKFFMISRNSL